MFKNTLALIVLAVAFSFGATSGVYAQAAESNLAQLLPFPDGTPYRGCAGDSFTSDGAVVLGACRTVKAQPCSGRGCQPVTYTTLYNVEWIVPDATPSTGDACVTIRHHLPQANTYTYLNGHVAGECRGLTWWASTVTTVNGAPYYLVAVAPSGLYEIVTNFSDSFLVTF